jgi:hypothetical protein
MNVGTEALVCFVGAHGDTLEFLEFAEEVLDQMTPFVEFKIERQGQGAPLMLRNDDFGPAIVQVGDDGVAIEGLGAPYGLALSLPFTPWPWRWTLTMVASIMAYSISGSSEQASKCRTKTSALAQFRYCLKTVFQLPNRAGRPRHGLPVPTIQRTVSMKRRLSLPLRPGSTGLPRQFDSAGSFVSWRAFATNYVALYEKGYSITFQDPLENFQCIWLTKT